MTNEEFVRQAYATAEVKDIPAWIECFNPDGVFVDESVAVTYRGPDEVGKPVENYGAAFSDMHRELYDLYVSDDTVVVELALQGTHDGPLWLPQGILPPTGNRMDAPCCDVFRLKDGKIQLYGCYPSGRSSWGSWAYWDIWTPCCGRQRRSSCAVAAEARSSGYLNEALHAGKLGEEERARE